MGCRGCPEKNKNAGFDKHGNPIQDAPKDQAQTSNAMSDYEKEVYDQQNLTHKVAMSYKDYLREKRTHREKTRELSDRIVKGFSEDYKRIQVDELISVVNNEEVHRLSPTQSLVMLHELVHHNDYQKIINEFEGLKEQVDAKYEDLIKQKIVVRWNPNI